LHEYGIICTEEGPIVCLEEGPIVCLEEGPIVCLEEGPIEDGRRPEGEMGGDLKARWEET